MSNFGRNGKMQRLMMLLMSVKSYIIYYILIVLQCNKG